MPALRLAVLWLAAWALLVQAIVPTHLIGTTADPIDRLIMASLCHPGQDGTADGREDGSPADPAGQTCPQCIFCIPGHSLLAPPPIDLPIAQRTTLDVLVPRWAPVSETPRRYARPSARAPPAIV